jgi:hypothetical protein
MTNLRNLAEDLVYHIAGKLYDEIDPVWLHEEDYQNTVLEIEDMLYDQLAEIQQN